MFDNIYDDNLRKYLQCENWYMNNKIENILPGGFFHEAFLIEGQDAEIIGNRRRKYVRGLYWEMYFGDYFNDIFYNRKIAGFIGLCKLFVSQFWDQPMKFNNFWGNDFESTQNAWAEDYSEDVLGKQFDIFLKMLRTNNWDWFTDYSSRFYYYGGNYGPAINAKLFLHTETLFKLHYSTYLDSFKFRPLRSLMIYAEYSLKYQLRCLFGHTSKTANMPSREKLLIRPYLKYYAQKKLVSNTTLDYKLFYTNLSPLAYKTYAKPFNILPFMREIDNFSSPYNYNKPSGLLNKNVLKTLRNLNKYHNNVTPGWSYSLHTWDDPHFHEVSLPIIMDTFDYQEFKPEIDNRGYYRNKLQNEISRKFPLIVLHFEHFFLFYLTLWLYFLYTGGTETQVKEGLKVYMKRINLDLIRPIEIIDFCPPSEQMEYARRTEKYTIKNKLRKFVYIAIIVILILLYPVFLI